MSTILEELILPSIAEIGMKPEENRPYKNCGFTYSVLPEVGDGFYWVYGYENQFAVVVCSMTLRETVQSEYNHPAFYTIGSYDNISARFVTDRAGSASRMLLGYSRPRAMFHEVLRKGYSGKGVSISLSASFAEELAHQFDMGIEELTERCFSLNGTERIPEANAVLQQLQFYTPTPRFACHYYESKLMELLSILCQRYDMAHPPLPKGGLNTEDMENLRRVTDYIQVHYMEPFDLQGLSSIAYMGRTKLTQAFKRLHGVTITQYVQRQRVENAEELLKDERLSLKEISDQLGYRTQGSFSELFKEATGLTPREYRRLFRGDV